ncbi:hypothetical protein Nepgr_009123 [Nepenthes gracilis]|uniref:Uncharacterized protein n=1 Tax=Nepenthes gracilis TaxID=150966 RepID=A0AAD3SA30_NEPGR|nr:hypothetical protein Nepgr_009123 [Nepenthes gracilis]
MDSEAASIRDEANELLKAQVHVWNHMLSFINSMSLKCAVELGIPDAIQRHGKPMSLAELETAICINGEKAQSLGQLMRALTQSGFFEKKIVIKSDDKEEGYVLTKAGQFLVRENPLAVTPFMLTVLDQDAQKPWHCLSNWFHNEDRSALQTAHGKTLWELVNNMPKFKDYFKEATANDNRLVATYLFDNSEEGNLGKALFEGLNSLVDVGGGTGAMTEAIANACPWLNCICFDLPHVVVDLQGSKNLTFIGGNMFEAVPQGDAILLKSILHDWNDEKCVKILKQCKEAIMKSDKGGKVIIIDIIICNQAEDHKLLETQLFFDLQVMVLVKGKHRDEAEWHKLFLDAGFTQYKIISKLGVRSIIEIYP